MLILFLDTETTSLYPNSGQIIEIAGAVIDFDPQTLSTNQVSQFSTLVALRQKMDDRITRLTGITHEELLLAPSYIQAQESWANWVEQFKIEAICGHNIDFDIDFIRHESWYLPSGYKRIDTVELSKMLLPHAAAVNLEYLSKKDAQMNTSGWNDVISGDNVQTQSHRALDDALMCLQLFNRLLKEFVEFPFEAHVQKYILTHFLPLPIIVFERNIPVRAGEQTLITLSRGWFGYDEMNTYEALQIITHGDVSVVNNMLHDIPPQIGLILIQILSINTVKTLHPDWKLRFHTYGPKNFILFNLIASYVITIQDIPKVLALPPIEQVVWTVGNFFEDEFVIGNCAWIADLLYDIRQQETELAITQFISSYHFLEISLQTLWQKSEYSYNPHQMRPEEGVIRSRLIECLQKLQAIQLCTIPNPSSLEQILLDQLKKLAQQIQIDPERKHTFRNKKGSISICTYSPHKNLQEYISHRIDELGCPIESNLSPAHLNALMIMTGLKEVYNLHKDAIAHHSMSEDISVEDNVDLLHFVTEQLDISQQNKKPTILLAGQNSTLKDIERTLIEHFDNKDFLVIGESGSITKITSKLLHNFAGIVCVKSGDIAYIVQQINTEFNGIWQINKPYFYIHHHWRTLCSGEQLETMKKLHLYSKLGQFEQYNRGNVGYIKSY